MVRRVLGPVGLLAFAIVLFAMLAEIGLRLAFFHSRDFSMEMWKYAVQLKHPVADPQLSFAHVPNGEAFLMGVDVKINSQGLRDQEYPLERTPGSYRIMMLGDSTTLGWGVRLEDTAAKILERQLNESGAASGRRFEVLNAGVGNYDTVQEVTYYKTRGRAFRPDMVILVYFINDPEPVPTEKKGLLIDRSYLIAFTTNRFDGILRRTGSRPEWKQYYASLYRDQQPGFQACKASLQSLASTTRSEGTQLLVALLPELHQINENYPFTAEHQKIKDVVTAEGVPVMDLIEGLRNHGPESTLWVTPQDDHPNAKANGLVAAQLQDWILTHLNQSSGGPGKEVTSIQ
ncbi:MAG TPA: SGNH/GDSL hydrolase family protein [Terriglobia bacterium]|nr:SGNH/GDSL hydrolase family protein [Terriglobia bacterium]